MNDAQRHRPVTSKARGICKYYASDRGCFAGNNCKFLHASEPSSANSTNPVLTPYDKAKRCNYYAKGISFFCFRHFFHSYLCAQAIASEETSVGSYMSRTQRISKTNIVVSASRNRPHLAYSVCFHLIPYPLSQIIIVRRM